MMNELPYTADNVKVIQYFLKETKERISNGVEITYTAKANSELQDLMLEYEITISDIE